MKVQRRYIAVRVRLRVALRQLSEAGGSLARVYRESASARLLRALAALSAAYGGSELQLHHRPALVNRPWNKRRQDYDPPANSPEHLFYVPKADHDIETRVRGLGAQRSDLGQRRYLKRVKRNREPMPKRQLAQKGKLSKSGENIRNLLPKRAWPSRPMQSGRSKIAAAASRKGWRSRRLMQVARSRETSETS